MVLNVAETRHVYVGPINKNGMGHQMNIKTAVGAALLGIFWSSSMAFAFDTASKAPFGQTRENFAREFGGTLPPVGFVQFCASNPLDCKGKGGKTFGPDGCLEVLGNVSGLDDQAAAASESAADAESLTMPAGADMALAFG